MVTCTGTMRDCKNGAADGCETDVSGDLKNCGACGSKCPLPAHGAAVCVSGKCGVTSCDLAYKDCNNDSADGCEIDTARDSNNCGSCGNKCPGGANGVAACVAGKCVVTCNAPYLDCNGDATDGCEINGDADLNNCGICKNICPTPTNGNAACAGGTCIVSSCQPPFLTCQPGPINRCETNTSNDVNNCSACNKVCGQVANGTPGCMNSACGIKSCNAPYQDCDKSVNNGCEVDTSTDANNCASCGYMCPAVANGTPGCAASTCGIKSCNAPYQDCDKAVNNGCEVNTSADNKNCGQCGKSCLAGQVCYGGSCVQNRVLIVHASGYVNDTKNKLMGTGAFSAVDLFDTGPNTPSLALLQTYNSVLVFSDYGFGDPDTLGNTLADYYDGGGRVVVAVFGNASVPVYGRWASGNYHLVNPVSQEEPPDYGALKILDPNSPLMVGVSTLTADAAYRSTGKEINGGVVIARWGSGAPLVVARTMGGRNLVSLNFYPPSSDARSDFVKGDYVALLKNALFY